MNWKVTKPTVYFVGWEEQQIYKAGYSMNQRWRAFVIRGAVVIKLTEFDRSTDAFAFETVMDVWLSSVGLPAFETATDAVPYLGGSGGGYKECYRMPGALPGGCPEHYPKQSPEQSTLLTLLTHSRFQDSQREISPSVTRTEKAVDNWSSAVAS